MPYRRLPNTDQARLHALQTAVQRASEADFNEQVIKYHTLTEAQRFLMNFENQVQQYQTHFQTKVDANKKYRHNVSVARMYISHFIQVLNMTVQRGEIKKEHKKLYKLDPEVYVLPELTTEDDLLEWGKNIIEGEAARIAAGGYPLANPSINKVRVYFDMFKEQQVSQKMHRRNTERVTGDMTELRQQADAIILDIWNQVEDKYRDLLPYARLRACQNYGLIYYYRSGEKKLTPETDAEIRRNQAQQPELGI
ncbi:MAG: hypothetical protein KBS77_01130 [Bacteroidales bacterium]|nr:hypothetical protein [Candidatus Colicola faecequi]